MCATGNALATQGADNGVRSIRKFLAKSKPSKPCWASAVRGVTARTQGQRLLRNVRTPTLRTGTVPIPMLDCAAEHHIPSLHHVARAVQWRR